MSRSSKSAVLEAHDASMKAEDAFRIGHFSEAAELHGLATVLFTESCAYTTDSITVQTLQALSEYHATKEKDIRARLLGERFIPSKHSPVRNRHRPQDRIVDQACSPSNTVAHEEVGNQAANVDDVDFASMSDSIACLRPQLRVQPRTFRKPPWVDFVESLEGQLANLPNERVIKQKLCSSQINSSKSHSQQTHGLSGGAMRVDDSGNNVEQNASTSFGMGSIYLVEKEALEEFCSSTKVASKRGESMYSHQQKLAEAETKIKQLQQQIQTLCEDSKEAQRIRNQQAMIVKESLRLADAVGVVRREVKVLCEDFRQKMEVFLRKGRFDSGPQTTEAERIEEVLSYFGEEHASAVARVRTLFHDQSRRLSVSTKEVSSLKSEMEKLKRENARFVAKWNELRETARRKREQQHLAAGKGQHSRLPPSGTGGGGRSGAPPLTSPLYSKSNNPLGNPLGGTPGQAQQGSATSPRPSSRGLGSLPPASAHSSKSDVRPAGGPESSHQDHNPMTSEGAPETSLRPSDKGRDAPPYVLPYAPDSPTTTPPSSTVTQAPKMAL